MKNSILRFVSIQIFLLAIIKPSFSWEPYDKIIATVNDSPIIESDIIGRFMRLQKKKAVAKNKLAFEQSRLLDKFISDALILQEAQNQSIIVKDEKVDNHIKKLMDRMNLSSKDDFRLRIEKSEGLTLEEYREEVRKSMITEQVMSISIGVSPPSRKEAMDWYKLNRDKLGFEVNAKHILIRPKNNSLTEEKRVNDEMKKLMQKIKNGESFEALASAYSEDPGSAKKGGELGWVALAELDPYFANAAYQMSRPGQISDIVKSNFGYHIIKFLGKRPISFDTVEDKILNMIFQQKLAEQFNKWVVQKRKESDIKIYMSNYVKA
jgi:putative peptidyl-prolyl cis-trans isomerase